MVDTSRLTSKQVHLTHSGNRYGAKTPFLLVEFHHKHNHEVDTPSVLCHRDVSDATRAKLLHLFSVGYNAKEALQLLKEEVYAAANVDATLNDRAVLPGKEFVQQ